MKKSQIHKRISNEQAKFILQKYNNKELKAKEAIGKLGIKKSRFYEIIARYNDDVANFTLDYKREKSTRILTSF